MQAGVLLLYAVITWGTTYAQQEKPPMPEAVEIFVTEANGKPVPEFEVMVLVVERMIIPGLRAWQAGTEGKARVALDARLIMGGYPDLRVAVRSKTTPFKVVDFAYEEFEDGQVSIQLSPPCQLTVEVTDDRGEPTEFLPRFITREFVRQVSGVRRPRGMTFSLAQPLSSQRGKYRYPVPRGEEFFLLFSRLDVPYYYQSGPHKCNAAEDSIKIELPAPGGLIVRFSVPEGERVPAGFLTVGTFNEVLRIDYAGNILREPVHGPVEHKIHGIAPGQYRVQVGLGERWSELQADFRKSTTVAVESGTTASAEIVYAPFNIESYRGKHRLCGTLHHSDGSPLTNTTVTLQVYIPEYGEKTLGQTRTDSGGRYCFENLNPEASGRFTIAGGPVGNWQMETGSIRFASFKNETTYDYAFSPQVGKVAADFEATDLRGNRIALEDFRSKVVFLKFWATWCGPCRPEIAELGALVRRHAEDETWKDFAAITVSLDDDRAGLEQYLKKNNLEHLTVIFDGKGWENPIARRYALRGIPATFIIDQKGKVVSQTRNIHRAEGIIERLLKGETVEYKENSL